MKAVIFNGSLERRSQSTSGLISSYISQSLTNQQIDNQIFNLADSGIPLFDITNTRTPKGVEAMSHLFLEADIHFWLAPLYHGGIPGVMKNCLDWLEITAKNPKPYLTDKTIGLICWAEGMQAMQGINAMDSIAKALRAWPLPFSVPIARGALYETNDPGSLAQLYKNKIDLLLHIATTRTIAPITTQNTTTI